MQKAFVLLLGFIACSVIAAAQEKRMIGPHVFVYKAKKNYYRHVPVVLSDDRTKIVSYPDPHDIKNMSPDQLPQALHKGYYMDKNGVDANTVFLKLTYVEYAKLGAVPATGVLYKMILSKNPLTILYDCGPAMSYTDVRHELNSFIDKGQLRRKCKTMPLPYRK